MAVAHILTKNNSQTIRKTLESISFVEQILVADLGSEDNTIDICEEHGAIVERLDRPRHEARNHLISMGSEGWNFFIEPWEAMVQGHGLIDSCTGTNQYCTILHNKLISKEIRLWKGRNHLFKNPVYESLIADSTDEIGVIFYSSGRSDYDDVLNIIRRWKSEKPTAISPWYYEACTLLAQGKWAQFMPVSEHYMALDPSNSMSAIMNRYYYAMGSLIYTKKIRPALQNLSLCLSERPLMAEFWCLMGDAFYHISKDFRRAQAFYRDAMKLGARRLKTDKWPMDLNKYRAYPEKMIESCKKLEKAAFYVSSS